MFYTTVKFFIKNASVNKRSTIIDTAITNIEKKQETLIIRMNYAGYKMVYYTILFL